MLSIAKIEQRYVFYNFKSFKPNGLASQFK